MIGDWQKAKAARVDTRLSIHIKEIYTQYAYICRNIGNAHIDLLQAIGPVSWTVTC